MPEGIDERLIEEQRYARQANLWGENAQQKWAESRVAVVGMGPLGNYISLLLTLAGVGNIVLIGKEENQERQFAGIPLEDGLRAEVMKKALHQINPSISIEAYPTDLKNEADRLFLKNAIIVDATNSIESKEITYHYCSKKNIK